MKMRIGRGLRIDTYVLRLLLFSAAGTLGVASLFSFSHGPVGGDADIYARMAAHPFVFTTGHWGYRILTPWIVHLLPVPYNVGFWLVSVCGLAGAATTLGLFCRDSGLSRRAGFAAAMLFLLSFGCVFDLADYQLVDPLAYLGTTLMFALLARQRLIGAALCVLVTTIDKEWGLFLVPAFVMVNLLVFKKHRARVPIIALSIGVAGSLAAFWLIRHWPGFGSHDYHDSIVGAFHHILDGTSGRPFPPLFDAFGLLWVVAPLGWRAASSTVRATALLLPCVALQWAQAGALEFDRARMIAFAFPCVMPLFLTAIDQLTSIQWGLALLVALYCTRRRRIDPLTPRLRN